jgi:hypothetical protein
MTDIRTGVADAYPRKHFFVEMFTRDISLEDCILDLIDNSIDSLIRTRQIDVSSSLLKKAIATKTNADLPLIEVNYSEKEFSIKDNCGGISRNLAQHEVFTFGHSTLPAGSQLGVYGIGLKRAIFKLGSLIDIESKTKSEGFRASFDLDQWAVKENDWTIPLTFISGSGKLRNAGTKIRVDGLRPEVRLVMSGGTFENNLIESISKTYTLFLNRYVCVKLNNKLVAPQDLPLGSSESVKPAVEKIKNKSPEGKITTVTLICGLAARGGSNEWTTSNAGWYVLCNGRIVVAADKTELTGWTTGAMPTFHSKYAGFVGIAFFYSKDPRLLPWTTTKRGLNREAKIYLQAKNKMALVARPIINFLNKMYPADLTEEPRERTIANQVRQTDIRDIAVKPSSPFTVAYRGVSARETNKVQYDAKVIDLERIRKHLRKPTLSATRIRKITFDHYVKTECPE